MFAFWDIEVILQIRFVGTYSKYVERASKLCATQPSPMKDRLIILKTYVILHGPGRPKHVDNRWRKILYKPILNRNILSEPIKKVVHRLLNGQFFNTYIYTPKILNKRTKIVNSLCLMNE